MKCVLDYNNQLIVQRLIWTLKLGINFIQDVLIKIIANFKKFLLFKFWEVHKELKLIVFDVFKMYQTGEFNMTGFHKKGFLVFIFDVCSTVWDITFGFKIFSQDLSLPILQFYWFSLFHFTLSTIHVIYNKVIKLQFFCLMPLKQQSMSMYNNVSA